MRRSMRRVLARPAILGLLFSGCVQAGVVELSVEVQKANHSRDPKSGPHFQSRLTSFPKVLSYPNL